ncbi:hypothetical protein TRFO_17696 [Tritrichomonas foetus]|uniref:non-specific serine/threonine protein kinase n=1 Tax=Tritrichomonas foetus TaxID=1144522 RepID=A0A1J4KM92_9EUKA|nr:hypothetical protein TRFO_17696 [Tritrichomonas foetus]|eukprot:OHT12431.1 hypothetical protein TRFO_17696 [Tritrichomonas foetus]
MNEALEQELSILQTIVGEENVVKLSNTSIQLTINSPSTNIKIEFSFPADYPQSPPSFELTDSGSLLPLQEENLTDQIEEHFQLMSGFPTLIPLVLRIDTILRTRFVFPIVSPNTNRKTRRFSRKDINPISTVLFPADDLKNDSYLAFFFYKAIQQHKNSDQTFLQCLDNLRALGLLKSDDDQENYEKELQKIIDFISNNQSIPTPIRDILLSKSNSAQPSTSTAGQARFFKLFTVADTLGRGGYGSVIKARYKFDDAIYAVKCIPIDDEDAASDLNRECKILSCIHHRYIVRYYFAWIDHVTEEAAQEIRRTFHFDEDDNLYDTFTSAIAQHSSTTCIWNDVTQPFSHSSPSESFSENDDDDDDVMFGPGSFSYHNNDTPDFGEVTFHDDVNFGNNNSESTGFSDFEEEEEEEEEAFSKKKSQNQTSFLFMQMEYCPGRSLDELFRDDSFFQDTNKQWKITREILEGLQYLHKQGIIHRDMKPSNIFIDENGNAKIGDFGLSRKAAVSGNEVKNDNLDGQTHISEEAGSGIQGSFPYTAPEVLKGGDYGTSSDMYSFGVILFEIWCQFSTMSERARILKQLTDDHQLPAAWLAQYPNVAQMVQLLIKPSPDKRPSASYLLQSKLIPSVNVELTNEDISDLLRAIKSGTIQTSTSATTVLDALFSETRKSKFAETESENNQKHPTKEQSNSKSDIETDDQIETESDDETCHKNDLNVNNNEMESKTREIEIETLIVPPFMKQTRLYGASVFSSPMIEPLTLDQTKTIPVLRKNGSLYALQGSTYHFMMKEIMKNNIRSARFSQFTQIITKFNLSPVEMCMSFDIITDESASDPNNWTDLLECFQFAVDYIKSVMPEDKIRISAIISSSDMALSVCESTKNSVSLKTIRRYANCEKIDSNIKKMLDVFQDLKFDMIPDDVNGKEACDDFIIALKSLGLIDSWSFELLGKSISDFCGISCQIFVNGQKFAVVGQMYDTFYHKLKTFDYSIKNFPTPTITSCRIDFNSMKMICRDLHFEKIRVYILPTTIDFDHVGEDFLNMSSDTKQEKQWSDCFDSAIDLANHMREQRFDVHIAKVNREFIYNQKIQKELAKGNDVVVVANCRETFISKIFIDHEDDQVIAALKSWAKSVRIYCPGKFPRKE